VDSEGKLCNCGKRGCVEAYASGRVLNEEALSAGFADARALFEASKDGSAKAKEIVRRGIISIGTGVVNLVNLLSLEAVIFSGGLCSQEEYIEGIKAFVLKNAYSVLVQNKRFKMEVAKLKENAPMIGAAVLYKNL
jgi:glucokinase